MWAISPFEQYFISVVILMINKILFPFSNSGLTISSTFFNAILELLPLPSLVNNETGATQPFNSFKASFAECNRIKFLPGTFKTCR